MPALHELLSVEIEKYRTEMQRLADSIVSEDGRVNKLKQSHATLSKKVVILVDALKIVTPADVPAQKCTCPNCGGVVAPAN